MMNPNTNNSHDCKKEEKKIRPMALTIKGVVINDNGEVLLLKRAKRCLNARKWDLPGGHVDVNETVAEALEREVREETGLEITVGPIIRLSEFPKDHQAFKDEKRGIRFLSFYKSGQVKLNEREHEEFKWIKLDEAIATLEDDGFEKEKKETLKAAKEYLEMQNALSGWRRALADLENYKKRVERSNEEFRKYCMEDFVMELLPVIDNFEMATAHIPEKMAGDNWVAGLMHIKNQLETVLKNKGIEAIETKPGDEIDVAIHEVLSGGAGEGQAKVKKVLKKGYRLGDRVIRAAVVEAE